MNFLGLKPVGMLIFGGAFVFSLVGMWLDRRYRMVFKIVPRIAPKAEEKK